MYIDLNGVEVGLVVSLRILRQVMKGLEVNGRRWWVACDPRDAFELEGILIGYGHPKCEDILNTITFRLPVLNEAMPRRGPDSLVVMLEPSTTASMDDRFYMENGRIMEDSFGDRERFFTPLKSALIDRLQSDTDMEDDD